MMVNAKAREGFTLIEIVIAIAIGVTLTMFFGRQVMQWRESADKKTNILMLSTVKNAVEMYYGDTRRYPEQLQDLITKPSEDISGWDGPYIKDKKELNDNYGHPFVYQSTPEAEHPYELYSKGKDGKGKISAWER